MTSTDFLRKVQYYSNWIEAFDVFMLSNDPKEFIWKLSIYEFCGSTHVKYSSSPFILPSFIAGCQPDTIVIERYSRLSFDVDFKYFKSFVSKLSPHQAAILYRDARFTNLLKTFKNV